MYLEKGKLLQSCTIRTPSDEKSAYAFRFVNMSDTDARQQGNKRENRKSIIYFEVFSMALQKGA